MDEPASNAIGTSAKSVEGLADLSLILGVTDNRA